MKSLPPPVRAAVQKLPAYVAVARDWLTIRYEPRVLPDAVPFLNPIDGICEEAPPRIMWSAHYIIMAMFLLVVLVATIMKVDVVVVGTGTLTTESPPMILQPISTGIIRELKVRPGDTVHKDQVLAVLDSTFAHADYATLGDQQRSLAAQIERLDAEVNDKPYVVPAGANSDQTLQYSLYQQRHDLYRSRLSVFDEDLQRLAAAIHTTEDDRASLQKQVDYAKELESMRGALLQSQNGSKLNYLDAQSLRVRAERDYQDAVNRLAELQHTVLSKRAERQNFIDEWRRQALENLMTARNEAAKVGEAISKAALLNDLVVVTAPADGVVLDVAKRSVGSIIREAEPLVTIVPSDTPLVADVIISSSDVGHIQPGDEVVVKVDAFPYQRHGLLKGRLLYVSEESYSMTDAGGTPQGGSTRGAGGAYHRGRVMLEDTHLENLPTGARLIPGMTVSAEIKVGTRRIIAFFIYPLTRGLRESLREP